MDVAGQRRHGQAEVTDLDAAVVIDETVRRLDVAVKNAGRLRRVQAADDVEHGCRRLFGGQWPVCDDAVLQCAARQQLHRDDGHAGDFVTAEDVDRMWMTDRRGELSFAQESGPLLGSLQPAPQDLQRDAPSAVVFRLVDLAHPAATEQPADPIRAPRLSFLEPRPHGTGRRAARSR